MRCKVWLRGAELEPDLIYLLIPWRSLPTRWHRIIWPCWAGFEVEHEIRPDQVKVRVRWKRWYPSQTHRSDRAFSPILSQFTFSINTKTNSNWLQKRKEKKQKQLSSLCPKKCCSLFLEESFLISGSEECIDLDVECMDITHLTNAREQIGPEISGMNDFNQNIVLILSVNYIFFGFCVIILWKWIKYFLHKCFVFLRMLRIFFS